MNENRRVRMTKKLIKEAYLEILEKSPSQKISVTDVCFVAEVNRSTFYMYYEDINFLRKAIEDEVMDQIPILSNIPNEITSDKQFVDILTDYFSYILENKRMFKVLILQNDSKEFSKRLISAVLEKYRIESKLSNKLFSRYKYIYIVSGVIGLLASWIEEDFPVDANAFSKLVLQMSVKAANITDKDLK